MTRRRRCCSATATATATAVAQREGRLRAGDRVLLAASGAGLVCGGTVVTWGLPVR
jgi:3-oxoacyl-[acyl-carrier-protein] synthase III